MLNFAKKEEKYQWRENLNSRDWDNILTELRGHPLQSANWGDSRKQSDGIKDIRLAAFKDGKPIYLIRVEERRLFKWFKIAWVPRGPMDYDLTLQKEFFHRLRKKGFLLCVTNPWNKIGTEEKINLPTTSTIWIDLTLGKEAIWNNLTKQFRYDVRRAKKMGVTVVKTDTPADILAFYQLCQSVSHTKKFLLNGSAALMSCLIKNITSHRIEATLFKALYDEKLCGGAFVIRCGDSVHYMWAAVDRTFSKLTIGEAIQWEIIEWALAQNCKLYDLEGIDPKTNPGTYHFKKKLGGETIILPGKKIYILNPLFLRRKYKKA